MPAWVPQSATRRTPLESSPFMSPRPCPPQPTTARLSFELATVEGAAPRRTSGPSAVAPATAAEALRKARRDGVVEDWTGSTLRCDCMALLKYREVTCPTSSTAGRRVH